MTGKLFGAALSRYAAATDAPDEVRAELRRRVDLSVGQAGSIRQDVPMPAEPGVDGAARVRRRIAQSQQALQTPWRPSFVGGARPAPHWRVPAFAAAAVACAAIALLWWNTEELDDLRNQPVAAVQASVPLPERELSATDNPALVLPVRGLELMVQGKGTLGGTHAAPVLDWRVGTLDVEVDPIEHIGLVVKTDEAEARVVGTGFTIERDLLGTRIQVRHGKVAVTCVGAETRLVVADEQADCLPVTPAGLLGRARTLSQHGASAEQILTAARDGLNASEQQDAVWGELVYLRMSTLKRADRSEEAASAAEDYIASGQLPRRDEALRVAGERR
jgi:hypothetical protein